MSMEEVNDKMELISRKLNYQDAINRLKKPVSFDEVFNKCYPKKLEYLDGDVWKRMLSG